jgi:hypothetical protein
MKHALALLLLSCVLCAQEKPAAVYGEIDVPMPAVAVKAATTKPTPPINVRDELIVEIHALKEQIARCRGALARNENYVGAQAMSPTSSNFFNHAKVQHESNITLLLESQRALLLALSELAKEAAKDVPTKAYHSSSPLKTGM